ncbi:unnamed protein product [Polarella glacialis]|uniref:60S acidic ribosomal protein P1 n=2 Tax=Polarella glacialis TaxID=89957 RepID=A0A813GRQ7_POLGL|nr:unnamed protein product [Polarella glacialis]
MAAVPASELAKEQQDELLCTYAALILHDDGAEITPEAMNNLIKASGNAVEGYWPMLFCKLVANVGVGEMIKMGSGGGGGGGGGGAAVASGGGGAAAPAAEEKKVVEEEEEEDVDFDLFGFADDNFWPSVLVSFNVAIALLSELLGYWPMLFCKLIGNVGMGELIKMGSGGGGSNSRCPSYILIENKLVASALVQVFSFCVVLLPSISAAFCSSCVSLQLLLRRRSLLRLG